MRSIISVITSFILLIPASGQGQWEILREGIYYDLRSVDFISDDIGWIAGKKGIFLTNDGAKNWAHLYDKMNFRVIDFYDESIGWAMVGNDSIMKTYDSGRSWSLQKKANDIINELYAVTDSIVYAIGDSILKTADGGSSWQNITPSGGSDFSSVCFINADTGIIVGNGNIIFRTLDGGESWKKKRITDFSEIYNVQFTNDSSAYFLARKWFDTNNQNICKTTDFFSSWAFLSETGLSIQACHFFDNGDMIAFSLGDEENSEIHMMKSYDGGSSWENIDSFVSLSFGYGEVGPNRMSFTENAGYFFGSRNSYILKSVDQGDTWLYINMDPPLNDVHFINREKGLVIGGISGLHHALGILLLTQDGGKTWIIVFRPEINPTEIHSINESKAFITGIGMHSGTVIPRYNVCGTTNGGYSWKIDTTIQWVHDIFFTNDSTGYATTSGKGAIYKTNNGGEAWSIFSALEPIFRQLSSIFFMNEHTGWVLDRYFLEDKSVNVIHKYTKERGWSDTPVETDMPLAKLFFINENIGWISGGYSYDNEFQTLLMQTVDGGENWIEIPGLDFLINDFYFENKDHGWAVGEDIEEKGVILETFDSGLNWKVVIDSLTGRLNSLHFADGYGWAVGDNGLLMKTRYASSSSVKRFMVVGDTHHSSPSQDFSQTMLYEITMAAIEEEVDFVFFSGDLVVRGFNTAEEEDSVLRDWRFVLDTLAYHNIKVYACRGNNDVSSRQAWDSLFSGSYSFPQNSPEMEKNITYAIEYDNLLFLALDQYTDSHKINQGWLDSLLTTTTSDHIFAAGHEPAFKLLHTNSMGAFPEERNLFWESLTDAGAKACFSGHDHFYDHSILDDGDGNPDNDIHQVIVGTGGGSLHADAEYDGDNGGWTPERLYHEEEFGYVLVEVDEEEVEMTWKHRVGQNIYEDGGDSYSFSTGTTNLQVVQRGNDNLSIYPNPTNGLLTVETGIERNHEIVISSLTGQVIFSTVSEASTYQLNFSSFQKGIYLITIRAKDFLSTKKIIKL